MGTLILTAIELAKTAEAIRTSSSQHEPIPMSYSQAVFIFQLLSLILRFLFHCVQYTFLFRYSNVNL